MENFSQAGAWARHGKTGLIALLLLVMALTAGCAAAPGETRASQGARTGATIGLLLGVLSGDSEVAARAVAVGAASGAYEGWRQDQDDQRTRQITQAIRQSSAQEAPADSGESRQREQLTRFLGVWDMQGWLEDPGEGRVNVTAQVNGNVVMGYFVEMAWIDLKAEGFDGAGQVWGTTTLGYTAEDGFEVSTRFNTLADSVELSGGRFDNASRSFTWSDADGVTTVRFDTPDRFHVETRVDGTLVESYQFTRT